MKYDNTIDALNLFGTRVVADAKANLVREQKVSSGELLNSVKSTGVVFGPNSLTLNISMADYGSFIDQGVSGVKVKYDTPFAYTTKMPPPSALDKWIVKKGIAPRTAKGEFLSRKSVQFAIARSIFFNGIKPTHFLTDAVKKNMVLIPQQIKEAFALDLNSTVNLIIKSNFKR
jgi:hypothetical protein